MKKDDFSINTLIGRDTVVRGDVISSGVFTVSGNVNGDLKTDATVIINMGAHVKGNIKSDVAFISGIVFGNVFAERKVKLLSTAVVIGEIISEELELDRSAILHGSYKHTRDSS